MCHYLWLREFMDIRFLLIFRSDVFYKLHNDFLDVKPCPCWFRGIDNTEMSESKELRSDQRIVNEIVTMDDGRE